jgi:hypothetical protein
VTDADTAGADAVTTDADAAEHFFEGRAMVR